MGFYSAHLGDYLRTFGQDRILALVFERAVKDTEGPPDARAFLGVPPEGFPDSVGKVNASTVPKDEAREPRGEDAAPCGATIWSRSSTSARASAAGGSSAGSALPKLTPTASAS